MQSITQNIAVTDETTTDRSDDQTTGKEISLNFEPPAFNCGLSYPGNKSNKRSVIPSYSFKFYYTVIRNVNNIANKEIVDHHFGKRMNASILWRCSFAHLYISYISFLYKICFFLFMNIERESVFTLSFIFSRL